MALDPLSSNIVNLLSAEPISSSRSLLKNDASDAGSFADIFTEAMGTANITDSVDKSSTLALLTGQTDDMSGLLIDSQKAEIALNLALSLRNKVLDAYSEIMRMQV